MKAAALFLGYYLNVLFSSSVNEFFVPSRLSDGTRRSPSERKSRSLSSTIHRTRTQAHDLQWHQRQLAPPPNVPLLLQAVGMIGLDENDSPLSDLLPEDEDSYYRGPPVGGYYELDVRIPVIGKQRFSLRILSKSIAELVIDGMLSIRDKIPYKINQDSGELEFDLSPETKSTMSRFKTSLDKASYCFETDTPSVDVKPPLPKAIRLGHFWWSWSP